jgi:peroxiredoxin
MKWRSLQESGRGVDVRPLREQLAERKALIAEYVPREVRAVHERAISELSAQGIAEKALPAGVRAPSFELKDQNGRLVSSSQLLSRGSLIVCFFRGRWCPFCVAQLEAMNQILPEIEAMEAALVGISPQTVQQSFFMAEQHKLRFPLLSDAGNQVAQQFGLVYRVPEYQQSVYRSAFVNLSLVNGENSWELPIPATYLIDRKGQVLRAFADADYRNRPEPAEIVEWLRIGGRRQLPEAPD